MRIEAYSSFKADYVDWCDIKICFTTKYTKLQTKVANNQISIKSNKNNSFANTLMIANSNFYLLRKLILMEFIRRNSIILSKKKKKHFTNTNSEIEMRIRHHHKINNSMITQLPLINFDFNLSCSVVSFVKNLSRMRIFQRIKEEEKKQQQRRKWILIKFISENIETQSGNYSLVSSKPISFFCLLKRTISTFLFFSFSLLSLSLIFCFSLRNIFLSLSFSQNQFTILLIFVLPSY